MYKRLNAFSSIFPSQSLGLNSKHLGGFPRFGHYNFPSGFGKKGPLLAESRDRMNDWKDKPSQQTYSKIFIQSIIITMKNHWDFYTNASTRTVCI